MFRRLPANRHIALLLAFALLAKLLVPAGWMPAFDGGAVRMEMCGWGPITPALAKEIAEAERAIAGDSGTKKHEKAGADQPCAFAGLSFAFTDVEAPTVQAPLADFAEAPTFGVAETAIGRGLAAPPPPSTGPPLLT